MKRILLLFLISIIQITALSQFDKVTNLFPYESNKSIVTTSLGKFLYVFHGYSASSAKLINLSNSQVFDLGSFGQVYSFYPAENGIFFISNDYGSVYINFVDTLGNVFISDKYSQSSALSSPVVLNNKFYSIIRDANYRLIEFDGTNSGTSTISISNSPLEILSVFDGKVIFSQQKGNQFLMYWINDLGQMHLFDAIPKNEIKRMYKPLGAYGDEFYFNVVLEDFSNSVQRMDTLGNGLELFIDSIQANSISFTNDTFEVTENRYSNSLVVYTGNINNPQALSKVPFHNDIEFGASTVSQKLPLNYYRIYSPTIGYEFGSVQDGKLSLVKDLAKGPSSSGVCLQSESSYGSCLFKNQVKEYNGALYSILSNGNDPYFYLYELKNKEFTSIIKIDEVENIDDFYISDGFLYLIRNKPNTSYIEKVNMENVVDIQPTESSKKESWFRQVDTRVTNAFVIGRQNQWVNRSKIDADGNVFLLTYSQKIDDSTVVLLSNSDITPTQYASNILMKYDKFGEVKWVRSFGDIGQAYYSDTKFTLDKNGDVLVFDWYFKEGLFDDLILNTNRVEYYVAKIDGETGNFVWVTPILKRNYTDIEIDGIVSDSEGNSYLAFMYRDFKINIHGVEIESDRSPVNAVAKFNTNGNIVWARNITSPWLDHFGRTTVFDFDETTQTITAVQSQGNYNVWSSCKYRDWGYYVQSIDLDGEILDTLGLEGNDIGSISVGTITNENRFFGMGYYRGELNTGSFDLSSNQECEDEGFAFVYDRNEKDILASYTTVDSVFYPFDITKDSDYLYVLGTTGTRTGYEYGELVILKFTHKGELMEYKELHQRNVDYSVTPRNYLELKDNYFVISGVNYSSNEEFGINPLMRNERTISLLKFKNENWKPAEGWFYKQNLNAGKYSNEMAVYPNPFSNQITIYVNQEAGKYTEYELYDIVGRRVLSGSLSITTLQEINTSHLQVGAYFLKLNGNGVSKTVKVVKAHQ